MSSSPSSATTERLTALDAAPAAGAVVPADDLGRLAQLGYRGTTIPRHRAVRWLDRVGIRTLNAFALAAAVWLALVAAMQPIAALWGATLKSVLVQCLPDMRFVSTAAGVLFARVPEPRLDAGAPSPTQWLNITAITVAVLLATALLPRRLLPAIYLLRFAALVQLSACAYFVIAPASYPYAGGAHATTMLHCGWASMLLLPWILAFCYYPLDFGWWRRIALTLVGELYFFVVTPLLAAFEAVLIQHGSLLVHPLIYLLLGPPLFVFWFVCLYGWGMSWRDARPGARK
ncbi:hypothetical protein [Cognatilysobacter terrigena]|uniref:hypothetical protein n=1 Tax=Cognatilysobacter terrigena TaxID=2488749 RepID=UPI00105D754B|nr:hypothetical protein [Lysobacter terrigena]